MREGYTGVAVGMNMGATERTVTDGDVEPLIARLRRALAEAHRAHLRD